MSCGVQILSAATLLLRLLLSFKIDETLAFHRELFPVRYLVVRKTTTPSTSKSSSASARQPADRSWRATRLYLNSSTVGDMGSIENIPPSHRNRSALIKEAEGLRARASEIYKEIDQMERELQESRSERRNIRSAESDKLIDTLFSLSKTNNTETVADRLQQDGWSTKEVLGVVDRISQRQAEAMGQNMSYPNYNFGTIQNTTVRKNETDYQLLTEAMNTLLGAVAILDSRKEEENRRWSGQIEAAVRSRMKEVRVAAEVNQAANSTDSIDATYFSRRTSFGNNNPPATDNAAEPSFEGNSSDLLIPLWVPTSFLPYIISCEKSTLGQKEVDSIINDVLMGSRFYLTSHDYFASGAAIFRGNCRTSTGTVESELPKNDTAIVFKQIQDRLQKRGLADSVQLFLLPDPEFRPGRDERDEDPKPVVLALSKAVSPDESKFEKSKGIEIAKKLMYPLSIMTTFLSFVVAYSLNVSFFNACVRPGSLGVLKHCVPPTIGVILVQAIHEMAHYFVAKKRRIKIGPPIPIPSFQLGMFGCITPLKSFPRTKSDLLDFALSGPLTSFAISLACLVGGIILSTRASSMDISSFPVVPALHLRSSFLVGSFLSLFASKTLMLPLAQPIPVHPLFLVGYAGIFASGLNLLPIFRLDGGRGCLAVFGQRLAAVVSVSMLLFLFSCALSGKMGAGLTWLFIITIFQRRQEIPPVDDVTEVDKKRLWIFLFSSLLSLSIITPFPGGTSLL